MKLTLRLPMDHLIECLCFFSCPCFVCNASKWSTRISSVEMITFVLNVEISEEISRMQSKDVN